MNVDHFAIVIGLWDYADLTEDLGELQSPGHDADSIYEWLIDPQRGGLRKEHVQRIKSSDDVPPTGRPTREMLEDRAFKWIEAFAKENRKAGRPRKVGRRLYLYMSGHGFSPEAREGCLLAGNASQEEVSANIGASLWLQWWQDAGYFDEYVLLMDCCMNRMSSGVASGAPLVPIPEKFPAGPTFVAFAAQRPLKAVEVPIPTPENKFHGAFTWAFLKGLEGAAANAHGVVTGHSMANWLRNAVSPWLSEADRTDPDVSKEPEIVAEDPKIIFARGVSPLSFETTLSFPPNAVGKKGRLWSGTWSPRSTDLTVETTMLHRLPAGLHLIEVPEAGLRQGFEVVRADMVEVSEKGPAVTPPSPGKFMSLSVDPQDETASITFVAADFDVVDARFGSLSSKLPFGLYKTQIRIGRQLVSRVILLDRDVTQSAKSADAGGLESMAADDPDAIALPKIASPIPLPDGNMSHEYQMKAACAAASKKISGSLGAELVVMARSFTEGGKVTPDAEPWKGIEIVDQAGHVVLDLAKQGTLSQEKGRDPFAIGAIALAPGTYFLRHPLEPKQHFEQALVAAKGWRLEAYILRRFDPASSRPDMRPRLSFLMRKQGMEPEVWPEPGTELLEKARVALADERPILNDELDKLLLEKFQNPILGIIGGHLLLLRNEQDKATRLLDLNVVVRKLRELVGDSHPDVEALSLRCPDKKLRRKEPILAPPMFERSWRLMIEGSQSNPSLVPLSLWQRVHALAPVPPFFAWSIDGKVQNAHREAIAVALGAQPSSGKESVVMETSVLESLAPVTRGEPQRPKPGKPRGGARNMKSIAKSLQIPPVALQVLKQRDGN